MSNPIKDHWYITCHSLHNTNYVQNPDNYISYILKHRNTYKSFQVAGKEKFLQTLRKTINICRTSSSRFSTSQLPLELGQDEAPYKNQEHLWPWQLRLLSAILSTPSFNRSALEKNCENMLKIREKTHVSM